MKSEFINNLECHLGDDDSTWILSGPLFYRSEILKKTLWIPTGFETDLASVPRIPFVFAAWGNRSHHEAVVHDYLYRADSKPVVKRAVADKIFLEAMELRGKPKWIRWSMYLGVRIGGLAAYHKKKVRV